MTVPPNVFAFFAIIGWSWNSDRTKERPKHILAGLALVMTGYVDSYMRRVSPLTSPGHRKGTSCWRRSQTGRAATSECL